MLSFSLAYYLKRNLVPKFILGLRSYLPQWFAFPIEGISEKIFGPQNTSLSTIIFIFSHLL